MEFNVIVELGWTNSVYVVRECIMTEVFSAANVVLYALQLDFLSEAEMMKWFDHKNIVKLLGVCTRGEPVYAVMEFMLHGM